MTELTAEQIQAIEACADEQGRLEPARVVETARDPANPLHRFFEWDDAQAAHAYRISQARAIIRRVRVEVVTHSDVIVVPKYLRDPDRSANQGTYRDIVRLKNETNRRRDVLVSELNMVRNATGRAMNIAIAIGNDADIRQIDGLRAAAEAALAQAEADIDADAAEDQSSPG